ncbi:hypothetical protein JK364_40800 [Streptomyces sp. 110]|uniref:Integrase n=1 Tax=Streptomyces endocoffeicus TaxID=2898945 RepID=A0ABS1Q2Q6_9ACTN|nr:hypothetical protein [Streptomyces endocoffeicus]MBL1118665.1 hypothetical protein [Streptomyces endocoffeicus]
MIVLYSWAFAFRRDDGTLKPRNEVEEPPAEIAAALNWIARKSVKVTDLDTPSVLRTALEALTLKLDGKRAAENTIHRKETVFSNALRYAVECGALVSLPLGKVDWKAPETDDEIDFRFVPGPRLAKSLIAAAGEQGERGKHLRAFFGCLYYAAMRPAEATDLRESACKLPEEGWGERRYPRCWSACCGTTSAHTARRKTAVCFGLTGAVTCCPRSIRRALAGRTVQRDVTGRVQDPVGREAVLLESGVAPAEVARRAGHSIAVLFRFYAKAIHGNQQRSNHQIEWALNAADEE